MGNAMADMRSSEALEELLVKNLTDRGLTITTAESCTGGLVAATIVNVAGSSAVFNQGFITYANEAKISAVGVLESTLEKYGAVSEQTAKEMAEGALKTANADVALATTGIAGPGGGTKEKPVGLVYVACATKDKTVVERCQFSGTRSEVRESSVKKALSLAIAALD